jgi:spore coat polysaccharide biosynthesis predicted glycosyltransferase SpsG
LVATSGRSSRGEVLVVADAGPGAGLGHVARCSAIATGLLARGVAARCLAVGPAAPPSALIPWESVPDVEAIAPTRPELLLLDSYLLDPHHLQEVTEARRLAVMHDVGPLPEASSLSVTTDPLLAGSRPEVIGGPPYSCLAAGFWGLPERPRAPKRVGRVLVTTGAGDPQRLAAPIASTVRDALPDAGVVLVRGPHAEFGDPDGVRVLDQPDSLLAPLLNADLAVTSAGNSLLEALAVGVPTVGLVLAENQRPSAEALAAGGATELCETTDLNELAGAVHRLAHDRAAREQRSRRGRELIDGYGALRVAFLLSRIVAAGR